MIRHLILLSLTLVNAACATQAVTSKIHGEERIGHELSIKGTEYPDYVRGKNISIPGEYYGITKIDNKNYHIIKLRDIRNNCGLNHDALLYLSTAPSVTPFIRESVGFEGTKIRDIDVVFAADSPRFGTYTFCSFYKFAESIEWAGYPDKINIYYGNYAQVQYGLGDRNACLSPIEDRLEWQCRSKSKYYATHALYPFSVAYDVVTLPLQWLLWMIFM